jgi:tetratricopeptide (TPR) repeat protein
MIVAIEGANAIDQDQKPAKAYTESQLRAKHDRLSDAMDRAAKLKKQGFMPRAIEEARSAVIIAKEEFGEMDLIAINPLLNLVELLGGQKLYEEAEESIEEIYTLVQSRGESGLLYGLAYRLRIAKLYVQWNMFDKAEATLLTARQIVDTSNHVFDNYTKPINAELKKVYDLKEMNRFRFKK